LGDECAIKVFCAEAFADDPAAEQEFHEEALLLAKVRHPGIVAVRDHFFHGLHAFLVMDFVPGDNLYDKHRRTARPDEDHDDVPLSPIPESQVAAYGIQLAETLAYLHKLDPPVIYRDLKPHNIICRSTDRRLILLDFGIARLFKPNTGATDTQAMGTPGYAAPEQYDDQMQSDPRTDLYTLGVVLFELATGHNPRSEGGSRKLPRPQDVRPGLSSGFAGILTRCSAWERDGRYQSAEELLDDLRRVLASGGAKHLTVPARTEPSWRFGVDAPMMATPSVSRGTLFLVDCRGSAYAVEMGTGHRRWEYRVPADAKEPDARTPVARTALGLSRDESLMAISFPCGEGMLGACLADGRTGTHRTILRAPLARQVQPLILQTELPAPHSHITRDDLVLALGSPNELICLSLTDRAVRWRRPLAAGPISMVLSGGCSADSKLIVCDTGGFVTGYGAHDGAVAWERRVCQGPLVASPLLVDDFVIAGGAPGDPSVTCLSANTGLVRWQAQIAGELVGPPVAVGSVLVLPTRSAGLYGLDLTSGETLWHRTEYSRPLVGAAVIGDTGLFALCEYGDGARLLIARAGACDITGADNRAHGLPIWETMLPAGGSMAAPVVGETHLVALGVNGTVCGWELGSRV
jgi:outer membrane protein assembly factor BamB